MEWCPISIFLILFHSAEPGSCAGPALDELGQVGVVHGDRAVKNHGTLKGRYTCRDTKPDVATSAKQRLNRASACFLCRRSDAVLGLIGRRIAYTLVQVLAALLPMIGVVEC